MKALLRPLLFSFALILAFASVTYVLPQMRGEAPEEKEVKLGELTVDGYAALGEELYAGKGTCTLCHNQLGRAPDMLAYDAVKVAAERIADPRYKGKAKEAESYLRESMVEPSAYVVKGFGKKGTDDTESPMPAVHQPPIQLSDVEIGAIIAYLQKKDGHPVTVALPKEAPAAEKKAATAAAPAPAQTAEAAIAKFGCAACHSVLGTQSPLGPSLADVGKRLSVEQIRTSIVDPKAVIAQGFPPIMPEFPNMTLTELDLLVRFLAQQKGAVK
ncbi:MAG TPA: c-type cytochrome [Burkholderiales bacterium]|nr:c-type cytochrome [Burkholderiales bacterium]